MEAVHDLFHGSIPVPLSQKSLMSCHLSQVRRHGRSTYVVNIENVDVMGTEFLEGCLKREHHRLHVVPREVNLLDGGRIKSLVAVGILSKA